jgi:hypothetical protein
MKKLSTEKTAATPKVIKLETLIKNGLDLKNRKLQREEFYIESLDGNVLAEELPAEVIEDASDLENTNEAIIYESIIEPNLKDKELQKALGCDSPDDVVKIIFKPGEINALSKEIVKLSGYGGESVKKVKDEIKN